MMNFVFDAVVLDSKRMTMFENMGRKFIAKAIDDTELQKAVTPDSRYGCKRPLVSDDFYPALNRRNVRLVHAGAQSINERGVLVSNGEQIDADVIVYCTGYKVMDFDRFEVTGLSNSSLSEQMAEAPEAYKGIAVPNFPNYFLSVGPNALVLSVSYYKSVEANVKSIVDLLSDMCKKDIAAIDVRPELHRQYNDWVVDECKRFSWGSGACDNYYINASGHSLFLYPGNFKHFLQMRAETQLAQFRALT
jgi:cation diffusion facilitator CzcD-associated flavoprotein CzcO